MHFLLIVIQVWGIAVYNVPYLSNDNLGVPENFQLFGVQVYGFL
jgi:hypothetical protein